MKKSLLLLFVLSMIFGSVFAQKNKEDSAVVKIIFNGHFKFFKKRIIDTTVFMRKDGKLFIQRNGEWIDTLYYQKKVKEVQAKSNKEVKMVKKKDSITGKIVEVPVVVPKYRFSGHWTGIEFGLNTFLDNNKFLLSDSAKLMSLNTGRSWAFHWNIIQVSPKIYRNKIGLVTGLGWYFNNYNFQKQVNFDHSTDTTRLVENMTAGEYKKDKLFISYLTIPLLIEFKPCHNFHFSFGAIGSLKLFSRQKTIFADNIVKIDKSDFNLNPFKLDLTARIGTNMFSLFANYSLTPLFKKNQGPELTPLTVGVGLSF